MIRKDDLDPLGPIGSKFEEGLERAASKLGQGRARAGLGATSRLDREIERLRTSPTPTDIPNRTNPANAFISGVPRVSSISRMIIRIILAGSSA